MQGSTESKPRTRKTSPINGILPVPGTLGISVILVTALAFTAGWLRNELALTLLGTVFLVILAYCYLGVFLLGILHRGKARNLSMEIVSGTVTSGEEAELCIRTGGSVSGKLPAVLWPVILRPAIIIRCELRLETRDRRVIRHCANPDTGVYSSFTAGERGAYYGDSDRFVIFDAPGFFRLSLPMSRREGARLLVLPRPADKAIPLPFMQGGAEQRNNARLRKSDELTDHRPYIPGDDPRRINWKLYGHAPLGELLVREGEPEPPPCSRLLLLLDTEVDLSLYTPDGGRRAVDLLCENALAIALESAARGMDMLIGYTGGGDFCGNGGEEGSPPGAAELAAVLAMPAAIFIPENTARERQQPLTEPALPQAPRDRSVIVLALPRKGDRASVSGTWALDRFLKNHGPETGIIFVHDAERENAAAACVSLYNRKPGVHAVKAGIPAGASNGKE